MADEYDILAEWITETLNADATLDSLFTGISDRVYDTTVIQNPTFPYISFTLLTAEDDLMYAGSRRVWASFWIDLVVIGKNMARAALSPVAARMDQLLHRGSGVETAGQVVAFTRQRPSYRVEYDSDMVYRYVGGVYLARVQASGT